MAHMALAEAASSVNRRTCRTRVLQSVYRRRPRRTDALWLLLSHRISARAAAGAAARGFKTSSASSAPKAMPSRKITPAHCARLWPGWRVAASAVTAATAVRSSSRNTWRPGWTPLQRPRGRRGCEFLSAGRNHRPVADRYRDRSFSAFVKKRDQRTRRTAMKSETKPNLEGAISCGRSAPVRALQSQPPRRSPAQAVGRHREQR